MFIPSSENMAVAVMVVAIMVVAVMVVAVMVVAIMVVAIMVVAIMVVAVMVVAVMVVAVMVIVCGRHDLWPSLLNPLLLTVLVTANWVCAKRKNKMTKRITGYSPVFVKFPDFSPYFSRMH